VSDAEKKNEKNAICRSGDKAERRSMVWMRAVRVREFSGAVGLEVSKRVSVEKQVLMSTAPSSRPVQTMRSRCVLCIT
jgi:hypothetical protein